MIIGRINNNYEEERLYSTGSDGLDELMERAFCEGYEYAQKEFAKKDYEGLSEKGKATLRKYRKDTADWLRKRRKDMTQFYDNDLRLRREIFRNQPDLDKQVMKSRNDSYQRHLDAAKEVSGIDRERALHNHPQKVSIGNKLKKAGNKSIKLIRKVAKK